MKTLQNVIRLFFLIALASVILPIADAQIKKSGKGYLFRLKFVKGDIQNYTISYSMGSGASSKQTSINIKSQMSVKVLDVKGDTAKVQFSLTPAVGAQDVPPQVVTAELDSTGRSKDGTSLGAQGFAALPQKPLPVGGTWEASLPGTGYFSGGQDAKATYKLVGFKKAEGKDTAIIDIKINPKAGSSMTGTGTLLLALNDGSLVRSQIKLNMTPLGADGRPGSPMRVTANVKRT